MVVPAQHRDKFAAAPAVASATLLGLAVAQPLPVSVVPALVHCLLALGVQVQAPTNSPLAVVLQAPVMQGAATADRGGWPSHDESVDSALPPPLDGPALAAATPVE